MIRDFSNKELYNNKFIPLLNNKKRYNILMGGGGSGKSVFIAQKEIIKTYNKNNKLIVVRKVADTIKDSAYAELKNVINTRGLGVDFEITKSPLYIKNRITGSDILFRGMDDPEKIKSVSQPTRIWIEEATELNKQDFDQLDIRLRGEGELQLTATFNPISDQHRLITDFWNYGNTDDVECFHSTYLDNKFVGKEQYEKVFARLKKQDPRLYDIYALGKPGKAIEGLIFEYNTINHIPEEAKLKGYGLDFGYNDPTALIAIYEYEGKILLDEKLYKTHLNNSDIVKHMKTIGIKDEEIYGDNSRPEAIEEIYRAGYNCKPCRKGKDSIINGIQLMKQYEILITTKSQNLKKEFDNYTRAKDKNGKATDKPIDMFNHCFVGNTKIETISGLKNIKDIKVGDLVLTTEGYNKVNKLFNNGKKQIKKYYLQLDMLGIYLECTFNHKIFTSKGWKQISELQSGQIIYLSKNLIENLTTYIQKKDISQKQTEECTMLYGNFITEKKRKDFTYTIKTITLGTIGLKILNLLNEVNTFLNIVKLGIKKTLNLLKNKGKKIKINVGLGINQKNEYNGIKNTQKDVDFDKKHIENENVKFVELFIQKKQNYKGFAETTVNQNIGEGVELITLNQNVFNVEQSLQKINMQKDNFVKGFVLKNIEEIENRQEIVYDIEVNNKHEYFANGVLVHNCIDGAKYGIIEFFEKDQEIDLFIG